MPYPALSSSDDAVTDTDADAIVLVLPPLGEVGEALDDWTGLVETLEAVGFTGAAGVTVRLYLPAVVDKPIAVVGTGPEGADAERAYRDAAASALRTLTGFPRVALAAPAAPERWRALAEGAVLGGYRFETYKKAGPKSRADDVTVYTPVQVTDRELADVAAIGTAVALVKDLVNTPAEWLGPADLADRARAAAEELPISVDVYDEARLAAEGFGGILGVGQGSERPPRLVHLSYAPSDAAKHVSLVGKGITFDTGGLSLKPPASMVGMKYDMCGAAVALAVITAAARLQLPVKVSAWLCIADNMPSGHATRPGDVLRMYDGTTVEVLNTDAEGRLVLGDGLAVASQERPDLLIDVATLTGAISIALGNRYAGVMGDDEAVASFLAASARAGEDAWQLPLPDYMEDELDSPIADLQNAKIGDPAAGSIFAGLFLRRFVGRVSDEADAPRIPWIHLDIAGVGNNKGAPHGVIDKGPTGAVVRSLIELVAAVGR